LLLPGLRRPGGLQPPPATVLRATCHVQLQPVLVLQPTARGRPLRLRRLPSRHCRSVPVPRLPAASALSQRPRHIPSGSACRQLRCGLADALGTSHHQLCIQQHGEEIQVVYTTTPRSKSDLFGACSDVSQKGGGPPKGVVGCRGHVQKERRKEVDEKLKSEARTVGKKEQISRN